MINLRVKRAVIPALSANPWQKKNTDSEGANFTVHAIKKTTSRSLLNRKIFLNIFGVRFLKQL